jgi:hypothetical protein
MVPLVDDVGCRHGGISCSDGRRGGVQGWIRGKACFQELTPVAREKFGRKAMSNDCARCVQSMCRGVPLGGLESAAGNKLEKMVCKGEHLSTLVKMGGRTALGVVSITRSVAPGHEAPFSLP